METGRRDLIVAAIVFLLLALALALPSIARGSMLEVAQVMKKEVDGVDALAGVLAIAVSADGKHVYTAAPGDDAVGVFARDPDTGTLSLIEIEKDGEAGVEGLDGATAIAISPDGENVYATGERDGAVSVFRRNRRSGRLAFVETHMKDRDAIGGLAYARAVAVSPDGRNVYVAGQDDDGVVVFSRNAMNGSLTYVESQIDGLGGVEGLRSAVFVAISPDGAFVYTAGLNDNAVSVFRRNAASGSLAFTEVLKEGEESFGILGAHTIALSPDGANVYVAGQADDALAAFGRSASTGMLSLTDVYADGQDGVTGLYGAHGIAVSPDGSRVFATGSTSEALVVFSRDPASGVLTYDETHNATNGAGALACARSVTVSPDGKNVYAAGASSNAVTVFRVIAD